jgi:WhiB family redox-sensing transcriptional regulator
VKGQSEPDPFEMISGIWSDPWRKFAACKDIGPDGDAIFFDDPDREQEAKSYCNNCSVRIECLDAAMSVDDFGIRGGLTEKERYSLKIHRKRRGPYSRYDLDKIAERIDEELSTGKLDYVRDSTHRRRTEMGGRTKGG